MNIYRCLAFLFCFNLLVLNNSRSLGQMRQVYLDNVEGNEVRKISFYSASEGYVAFRDWIGYTSDSGRTFSKKYISLNNVDFNGQSVNLTFGFGVNGIYVFNQNKIIVYGDYGLVPAILYSTNGGTNFKLVYHSQYDLMQLKTGITDMSFASNGINGYAVDADRVIKTADGGLTWTVSKTDGLGYFTNVEALDNNTCFVYSNNFKTSQLIKTTNGGNNWQLVTLPFGWTSKINSVNFLNSTTGWLSVNDNLYGGYLYKTIDGGNSWALQNNVIATPIGCDKMKFINDTLGYALVRQNQVFKTTNSGKIWEPIRRDNDFSFLNYSHFDLQVLSATQLWAGGGHGFLELNSSSQNPLIPKAYFVIDTTGAAASNAVKLSNYSKANYTYSWYLNNNLISTSYNATYTHDIYKASDTIKLVVSNGIVKDSTIKIQAFVAVPYPKPVISSFTPTQGNKGTIVTITGNYFDKVSDVSFGSVPASSFTVNSLTTITATLGDGANGYVKVTTATGTGSLAGFLTSAPPIIDSFSPISGPLGTIVTITGNNFSTNPLDNFVKFGVAKATVLTASKNKLTVVVPPGANYQPISITSNKHNCVSRLSFIVTFPTKCSLTENSFETYKLYTSKTNELYDYYYPYKRYNNMVVDDFNSDGKPDIVSLNDNGFYIAKNKSMPGNIVFEDSAYYGKYIGINDYRFASITIGDLDGDNKTDIATTYNYNNTISIWKNKSTTSTISFDNPIDITSYERPGWLLLNDLDSDGKIDMLFGNIEQARRKISILRNKSINGNIEFEPQIDFYGTIKPCIGDLDGDGKPELITMSSNDGTNSFEVYKNTSDIGRISFANPIYFKHQSLSIVEGALADIDGDGKLDIVFTYNIAYAGSSVDTTITLLAYHKNTSTNGVINFSNTLSMFPYPAVGGSLSIFGDLDGDGKVDQNTNMDGGKVLLKNTSTKDSISFNLVNNRYTQKVYGGGAINDLDGDGKPEIISTSGYYRNIIDIPNALAGKDTTICLGQSVSLGGSNVPENKYVWSSIPAGFRDTVSNPIVSPRVTTKYIVAFTNMNNCTVYDTVTVKVSNNVVIADAGPNKSICMGDSTTIGVAGNTSYTYKWTSIPSGFYSTQANPKVYSSNTLPITYVLEVNNGSCIARDAVEVLTSTYPIANAGSDVTICDSGNAGLGRYVASTYFDTYKWTSSDGKFTSSIPNPLAYVKTTTDFYLAVSNFYGCTSRDTITIRVSPKPIATAGLDKTICLGDSTIVGVTGNSNYTYTWYSFPFNGNFYTPTLLVKPTTTTIYYLEINNKGCSITDTLIVNVNGTVPSVSISAFPNSICYGTNTTFTALPVNGGTSPSYQWKKNGINVGTNSSTYSSSTLANNDIISVSMTSNNPCALNTVVSSNNINVGITSVTPSININGSTTITSGLSTTITALINNGGTSPSYQWQDSTSTHNWQNIGGIFGSSISYKPIKSGDKLRAVLISNASCATTNAAFSNVLTFTVNTATAIMPVPANGLGIKSFPNPVKSLLTIDNLRIADKWENVSIASAEGKQVYISKSINSMTKISLNIETLTAGYYVAILNRVKGAPVYIKFLKE